MTAQDPPFWRTKTLAQMSEAEWESLCDGCGRCCLVKLEEDVDGAAPADTRARRSEPENPRIYFTDVGCRLLDSQTCSCRDYPNRFRHVSDCVRLTPEVVAEIGWLPPTCAYRLLNEGRDLYWWHPLVSGDRESVHAAGISVRGRVTASEEDVASADLEDHIVGWPLRMPKRSRAAPSR
ncbi:MAG: YcgN family cysteine cluster protein [Variibacter sp.]|nr:YcgN family cysteine cluster protein [Variibacter sp.]